MSLLTSVVIGGIATPSGGIAPANATYVTLSTNATLTSERVLTGTSNQVIVTDNGAGSTVVLSTPQDIGTSSNPQFATIEVGNASDTTLSRSSAGNLAVEGNLIYRAGGTDVPVTDGGTGASTLTANAILLGNGTSAVTNIAAMTDGLVPFGISSAAPVGLPFSSPGQITNMGLAAATTTNANDSIKITGATATLSSTNPLLVSLYSIATPGLAILVKATSDITINLTGANWGAGTTGDLTNAYLRVFAINDNGTLKWGFGYYGGRTTIVDTSTSTTGTSVTLPEMLLVNSALTSGTWPCAEVGYFRANFDDTGGAAEDLWSVSTSVLIVGSKADGLWQQWNGNPTGFSANPTWTSLRWTSNGKMITLIAEKNANGTSNATTWTMQAPTKAGSTGTTCGLSAITDNGVSTQVNPGIIRSTANSATLDIFRTLQAATWTAASTKGGSFVHTYEAL